MKIYIEDSRGVAAVEFALMFPVLILLIAGIFDFGSYLNMTMKMGNTARAAAQYVAQGGSINNIQNDIILPNNLSNITVDAKYVCECKAGAVADCSTGTCASNDYLRHFIEVKLDMKYNAILVQSGLTDSMNIESYAKLQVN